MIVISDTTPISGLLIVGQLHILKELFGTIVIPPAVFQEIVALEKFGFSTQVVRESEWMLKLEPRNQSLVRKLIEELDTGEAEAIVLALELQADLIIMDENKGRLVAKTHGLRSTGTMGVLLRAKERGLLEVVKPVLDRLIQEANFWISDHLYHKILVLAGESNE